MAATTAQQPQHPDAADGEIQLFLVPQPGSKPEFLAACVLLLEDAPSSSSSQLWRELVKVRRVSRVVLEGYTRDAWAWKPHPSLASLKVTSTDGRNKLPGFLQYLKDRQKSAYGRIGDRGVWIVSYVQRTNHHGGGAIIAGGAPAKMDCRIALDVSSIPNCPLRPKHQQQSSPNPQQQQRQQPPSAASSKSLAPETGKRGGGLLGKLVGAQRRTNQHLIAAAAPSSSSSSKSKTAQSSASPPSSPEGRPTEPSAAVEAGLGNASSPAGASPSDGGGRSDRDGSPPTTTRTATAQQVFADFRQSMQDKMLEFDLAEHENVLRIPIVLTEHTAGLPPQELGKVTMEVLQYMVYEAAEEVNEEWVAHREPSEFVDEATFAVYKDGSFAPPEVLEELNRAELPDEIKGQHRALASERDRRAHLAEQQQLREVVERHVTANHHRGGGGDGSSYSDFEVLNQRKRDRRTIEDYERERREAAAKRGRS